MNRCLSEETLWQLYEGSGSREERAHVAKCQVCTIRYERLAKDLTLLGRVLRESPPQPAQVHGYRFPTLKWAPIALAGAAAVILLWNHLQLPELLQLSWQTPSPPAQTVGQPVDEAELARFFAKTVGPAIFATADFGSKPLPKHATSLSYLQAALNGDWPTERCEGDRSHPCESDPLALVLDQDGG